MKKEIADQWVTALRSGNYKQTKERLHRTDNTFCCLGVLCDISGLGVWESANLVDGIMYTTKGGQTVGFPPEDVRDWAGINSVSGCIHLDSGLTSLATLNDNGATFEEIADIIEQHSEEL